MYCMFFFASSFQPMTVGEILGISLEPESRTSSEEAAASAHLREFRVRSLLTSQPNTPTPHLAIVPAVSSWDRGSKLNGPWGRVSYYFFSKPFSVRSQLRLSPSFHLQIAGKPGYFGSMWSRRSHLPETTTCLPWNWLRWDIERDFVEHGPFL